MKKYTLYIALLLLISSCIQENPELVNPPLIVETVNVRHFNLSADKQARTMWFDTKIISTTLPFNSVSQPEKPPFDSVTVEVFGENEELTYKSYNKLKFGRLSNYIILTLPNLRPKLPTDTGFRNTDTLVYLQSSTLQPDDTNKCYIKFLNANPDTASSYSVKVGCPSGEHLFVDNSITTINYLQSTGTQSIYAGKPVISIVKSSRQPAEPSQPAETKVVGIFELDLQAGQQYALIANTADEVYLFDEWHPETPPLLLQSVPERTAFVRTINLSESPISVASSGAGSLATDLPPNTIGQYQIVSTCNSMSLDRIELQTGGTPVDTAFLAFDIYKNYSLLAFESAEDNGATLVVVPPLSERTLPRPGMATVRVANGNYDKNGVTVSTGAASAGGGDNGYSSGLLLAANLLAGECSEPAYLPAGTLPIAVFTATQPTRHLFSGLVNLEAGKDYILTLDVNFKGDPSFLGMIGVIESGQAETYVDFALPAAFAQYVNVSPNQQIVDLWNSPSSPIIAGGKVPSGELLSTFLPIGVSTLRAGSAELSLHVTDLRQRILAISSGPNGELFHLQGASMGADGDLRWRIINASEDCPVLNIYHTERGQTTPYLGVPFGGATEFVRYIRDKKYSFVFQSAQNPTADPPLLTTSDLLMTVNKNYSIIFYGNARTGYRIQMIQEY